MPQNEWTKRLSRIGSDLDELRLDAQAVGDTHKDNDLLTAARKITVAQSALTDVRSALLKVKE